MELSALWGVLAVTQIASALRNDSHIEHAQLACKIIMMTGFS